MKFARLSRLHNLLSGKLQVLLRHRAQHLGDLRVQLLLLAIEVSHFRRLPGLLICPILAESTVIDLLMFIRKRISKPYGSNCLSFKTVVKILSRVPSSMDEISSFCASCRRISAS